MRKTALKKRRWRTFAITGLEISYDFCGFLKNSPNKKREKDYVSAMPAGERATLNTVACVLDAG
jgi:hypothetical protein